MSWTEPHLIKESLAELADAEYQERVWLGTSNEVGSPGEALAQLVDDSGLGDALEAGSTIYDSFIDEGLEALIRALASVADGRPPADVLSDPAMHDIRRLAMTSLCAIVRHDAEHSRNGSAES